MKGPPIESEIPSDATNTGGDIADGDIADGDIAGGVVYMRLSPLIRHQSGLEVDGTWEWAR